MKNLLVFTIGAVVIGAGFVSAGEYGGGSGTAGDPYRIFTAEQMNAIGGDPNDWDKNFLLMNDISLGYNSFNIIGSGPGEGFTGSFDGGGHTISDLDYFSNDRDYAGLFGYVGGADGKGEVKNLNLSMVTLSIEDGKYTGSLAGFLEQGRITNCSVEDFDVRGDNGAGGLVGGSSGTIMNCSSKMNVSPVYGYVTGVLAVGGLVGHNEGNVGNCSAASFSVSGDVNVGGLIGFNRGAISKCHSLCVVEGNENTGGLVGKSFLGEAVISNCYSKGEVEGDKYAGGLIGWLEGSAVNCYSLVEVTGTDTVGGFVGLNWRGEVLGCLWDVDISGLSVMCGREDTAGSGCDDSYGRSTRQMREIGTYLALGWDFVEADDGGQEDIWRMCKDGLGFARLGWEFAREGDCDCPDGVGIGDLEYVAGNWLASGEERYAFGDVNGDSQVGYDDFAVLGGKWLNDKMYDPTVIYWDMYDDEDNTRVLDRSGFYFHGVAQRNTSELSVEGVGGSYRSALMFDGVGDYITAEEIPGLKDVSEASWGGWFRFDELGTVMGMMTDTTNGKSHGVHKWSNDFLYVYVGNVVNFVRSAKITDTGWHHVMVVFDGGLEESERLKVYVDGENTIFGVNGSIPATVDLSTFNVGGLADKGAVGYFPLMKGAVDMVFVFNRALSESEVLGLCERLLED